MMNTTPYILTNKKRFQNYVLPMVVLGTLVAASDSGAQLVVAGNQFWNQDSTGIQGVSEDQDLFGTALASGDFNGDGVDDLAIGVPSEGVRDDTRVGAVNVIYGTTATGLAADKNQVWTQNTAETEDTAEIEDQFGTSLASGDFNGDGIDDLAIGVPQENVGPINNAGMVHVFYGSDRGITATDDQVWYQDSPGILSTSSSQEFFGSALASGDFNQDGWDDLAIGVPGETVNSSENAGAVNIIYGTANGLGALGNQFWHQDSKDETAVRGIAESGDEFGNSLATGDIDNDGFDDLIVGVWQEDIGTVKDAGAIHVMHGSDIGITAANNVQWFQSSSYIQGISEYADNYGFSLATGYFDADEHADIAVGILGKSVSGQTRAGAVNVIHGYSVNQNPVDRIYHMDGTGMVGEAASYERFGFSLAVGDFNDDGYDDLGIGVSWLSVSCLGPPQFGHGGVSILYGADLFSNAITNRLWSQDVPGVADAAEGVAFSDLFFNKPDSFGASVIAGDFNGDGAADLAVGVPFENLGSDNSTIAAGAVNVLYAKAPEPLIFQSSFESEETE